MIFDRRQRKECVWQQLTRQKNTQMLKFDDNAGASLCIINWNECNSVESDSIGNMAHIQDHDCKSPPINNIHDREKIIYIRTWTNSS